jgi:CPA2 family monovalent cation:H+ antiporter-2
MPGNFNTVLLLLVKAIGVIVVVLVSAKWIVPQVLYHITKTRSQELFLLTVVVLCFSIAWVTSSIGLSLALGAFLAGLIISESEYSHQAIGNMLPFRDVFTSFFFVSIGMLLNLQFFIENPIVIILITISVLFIKTIIAGFAAIVLGVPLRTAILVGLAISQVGEFSFILSKKGIESGLLNDTFYQTFLAFSILTMAATPFIINYSNNIADLILKLPLPKTLKRGFHPIKNNEIPKLKDHLVIVGYGVNGRNLTLAARMAKIPYTIIEMNPETVRHERANGESIFYGDASQPAVLEQVQIHDAKVAVIAINDPAATRRITETIRRLNSKLHLIVRTRYLHEVGNLYKLGANKIIPEEYETSIEIFTRVLVKYLIPKDEIEKLIVKVRSEGYEMFRSITHESLKLSDLKLHVPEFEISALRVEQGTSLIGKSLAQTNLRKKYGVSVLAIKRDVQVISNPEGNTIVNAEDILFVLGNPEKIIDVSDLTHTV